MKELLDYIRNNRNTSNSTMMDKGISYFFSILKRLISSGAKYALLNDGLVISIYDIGDDSDENGFNHIFISMDNGEFYKQSKKLDVKYLYEKIRDDDKEVDDYRKSKKIKPSGKKSIVELTSKGFSVTYFLNDVKYKSYSYRLLDIDEIYGDSIVLAVNKIFSMYTDKFMVIKEDYENLVETFEDSPRTHMRQIVINDREINYPFMKSFLFGLNKPELMYSYINEVDVGKYSGPSNDVIIGDIYGYNIVLLKNDIIELHSSYIINYIAGQ